MEEDKVANQNRPDTASQNNPTESTQGSGRVMSMLNIKYLVTIVLVLVIGVIIGIVLGGRNNTETQPIRESTGSAIPIPTIFNKDPRFLLDPVETLKTPVFTEWGGRVVGIVVSKEPNSFTIEKSGRRLTITLQQGLSGFFREPAISTDLPTQITYTELAVGDSVRGGVTITRDALDNKPGNFAYANVFTILNENNSSQ